MGLKVLLKGRLRKNGVSKMKRVGSDMVHFDGMFLHQTMLKFFKCAHT